MDSGLAIIPGEVSYKALQEGCGVAAPGIRRVSLVVVDYNVIDIYVVS